MRAGSACGFALALSVHFDLSPYTASAMVHIESPDFTMYSVSCDGGVGGDAGAAGFGSICAGATGFAWGRLVTGAPGVVRVGIGRWGCRSPMAMRLGCVNGNAPGVELAPSAGSLPTRLIGV